MGERKSSAESDAVEKVGKGVNFFGRESHCWGSPLSRKKTMTTGSTIRFTLAGGLAVPRQGEGVKGKPLLVVGASVLHEEPSDPQPAARDVENSFSALMFKPNVVPNAPAYDNALSEPKAEERKLEESVVIHKPVVLTKPSLAQEQPRSPGGFWAWLCGCCRKKPSTGASV